MLPISIFAASPKAFSLSVSASAMPCHVKIIQRPFYDLDDLIGRHTLHYSRARRPSVNNVPSQLAHRRLKFQCSSCAGVRFLWFLWLLVRLTGNSKPPPPSNLQRTRLSRAEGGVRGKRKETIHGNKLIPPSCSTVTPAYLRVVLHDPADLCDHIDATLSVQSVDELCQVRFTVPDGPVLQCGVRPLVIGGVAVAKGRHLSLCGVGQQLVEVDPLGANLGRHQLQNIHPYERTETKNEANLEPNPAWKLK